jgi:hypothetical protein
MKYKEIEEDGGKHSNSNALQQKIALILSHKKDI